MNKVNDMEKALKAKIIEKVNNINDDLWLLDQIYKFITNITK